MSIDDAWDEKEKFWGDSDIMWFKDSKTGKVKPVKNPDAQPEKIHHPKHYSARNGHECIDIIRIMTKGIDGYEGYLIGNVIKYIFRYNEKNGVEDLKKSIKYLEFLIKEMEKNG